MVSSWNSKPFNIQIWRPWLPQWSSVYLISLCKTRKPCAIYTTFIYYYHNRNINRNRKKHYPGIGIRIKTILQKISNINLQILLHCRSFLLYHLKSCPCQLYQRLAATKKTNKKHRLITQKSLKLYTNITSKKQPQIIYLIFKL